MVSWILSLALPLTLGHPPEIVSLPNPPSKLERMGLRVGKVGGATYLVGGFEYSGRACLRDIGVLSPEGVEEPTAAKLAVGRNHFEMVPLGDHRFLVIGGYSEDFGSLAEVESVDVRTGKTEAWPWLSNPVELFSAISFKDSVAVIGGLTAQGETKTWNSFQLIDLKTHETSVAREKLKTSRFGQDSIALPNQNKVLVAGGKHVERLSGKSVYSAVKTLELWDLVTHTVTDAGEMTTARDRPKLFVLKDGKVLIIGGTSDERELDSIELYDPTTMKSKVMANMSTARMATLILPYKDQGLIIAGGWVDDAEAGKAIAFLDFSTMKVSVIGHAVSCRAEGAICWLSKDTFALLGGKDAFAGRNPHSYKFATIERFRIKG